MLVEQLLPLIIFVLPLPQVPLPEETSAEYTPPGHLLQLAGLFDAGVRVKHDAPGSNVGAGRGVLVGIPARGVGSTPSANGLGVATGG